MNVIKKLNELRRLEAQTQQPKKDIDYYRKQGGFSNDQLKVIQRAIDNGIDPDPIADSIKYTADQMQQAVDKVFTDVQNGTQRATTGSAARAQSKEMDRQVKQSNKAIDQAKQATSTARDEYNAQRAAQGKSLARESLRKGRLKEDVNSQLNTDIKEALLRDIDGLFEVSPHYLRLIITDDIAIDISIDGEDSVVSQLFGMHSDDATFISDYNATTAKAITRLIFRDVYTRLGNIYRDIDAYYEDFGYVDYKEAKQDMVKISAMLDNLSQKTDTPRR